MITINQEDGTVTLINVFSCEPGAQQQLVDTWIRASDDVLGKVLGIIYSALHRSRDGTRVVNYANFKSAEAWENLLRVGRSHWFAEMNKYGTKDPHLLGVCYTLDRSVEGEPREKNAHE